MIRLMECKFLGQGSSRTELICMRENELTVKQEEDESEMLKT